MSEWTGNEPPVEPHGPQPGAPYGGYSPYSPGPAAPGTDGISIAAFVSALTCCAGPIGIGLGIAGLVRTKGGRRRGRWAAIWGLVLGSIGTLAMIAAVVGLAVIGFNVVEEEDARVGQCVDTSSWVDSNDLWTAECDEEHDAEVVASGTVDADILRLRESSSVEEFCRSLAGPAHADALRDDTYRLDWSTDAVSDDIDTGDHFACYLERVDGEKLTEDLSPG